MDVSVNGKVRAPDGTILTVTGFQPIHQACGRGHLEVVQWLAKLVGVEATYDQVFPDGHSFIKVTLLHQAVGANQQHVLEWLVQNGADLNAKMTRTPPNGETLTLTPLQYAEVCCAYVRCSSCCASV